MQLGGVVLDGEAPGVGGSAVVNLCLRRSVGVLCRGSKARQQRARSPGGARVSGESE